MILNQFCSTFSLCGISFAEVSIALFWAFFLVEYYWRLAIITFDIESILFNLLFNVLIILFLATWCYRVSDYELCHSTSKPISDEEGRLKSFMAFDITPRGPIFRVVVGSQIVIPQQSLPRNDTPVTRTHDLGFDTIFRTVRCAIPSQNQLVMWKIHSNLLWNLTSHHVCLFLKWL